MIRMACNLGRCRDGTRGMPLRASPICANLRIRGHGREVATGPGVSGRAEDVARNLWALVEAAEMVTEVECNKVLQTRLSVAVLIGEFVESLTIKVGSLRASRRCCAMDAVASRKVPPNSTWGKQYEKSRPV